MKKILSLLLVLAMILSLGLFLASCDDEGTDAPKAPTKEELVAASGEKTLAAFCNNPTLISLFNGVKNANGIGLSFACDDKLFGMPLSVELSAAAAAGKNSGLISFELGGQEYAAEIFRNGSSLAVQSESIFGDSSAYLVNLDTVFDTLPESELGKLIGLDTLDPQILETLKNAVSAVKNIDAAATLSEIISIIPRTIEEDTLIIDGTEVPCYEVTYEIENEEIVALIDLLYSKIPEGLIPEGADLAANIAKLKAEIDKLTISYFNQTYVSYPEGLILESDTSMYLANTENGEEYLDYTVKTTYSENEIISKADLKQDGQTATSETKIVRTEENGKTTFNIVSATIVAGMRFETASASFTIDANGAFTLTLTEKLSGIQGSVATLSGKITASDTAASVTVNSVSFMENVLEFEFVISLNTNAEVKDIPAGAKDITTLTATEIQSAMAGIQTSPLMALISALMPNKQQ